MNNITKKIYTISIAACMFVGSGVIFGSYIADGMVVNAVIDTTVSSGNCGENVRYKIDSEGTLTISGTGDMYDYEKSDSPFKYNSEINKIVIDDGVTNIGNSAFYYCRNITEIKISNSVKSIGNYAFCECESLKSIEIPDSVESIGKDAFYICRCLTNIIVDENNKYYSSSDGALLDKNKTKLIFCPIAKNGKYVVPDGVVSIGEWAFRGCRKLTNIELPNSVKDIGDIAFFNCSGLENIHIPDNVENIGHSAFNGCCKLESVEIPNSVENIGSSAFDGCSNLKNIKMPDSLKSMGSGVFKNCINLTSVEIPEGVKIIGNYLFYNCDNLKSVKVPDSVTSIKLGAFYNCKKLKNVNIPNSITNIENFAFYNCKSLKNIKIPYGVKNIGDRTFFYCTGLKSIEIPDSVENIAERAFYGCKNLNRIQIPGSVISIGNKAFDICDNVKIYGYKDTYAETYANENDIPFVCQLFNNSSVSSSNVNFGSKITIYGSATGGNGSYEYAYYYKKSIDEKWTAIKGFSSVASVSIKPIASGEYDICIKVKDSSNGIEKKYFTVKVDDLLKNNSFVSSTNIKIGSKVTLNGAAIGGSGSYTYAYYYKKKTDNKWIAAKGFSSAKSVSVNLSVAADYDICIKVKDSSGLIEKKYFTVNISE